MSSTGADIVGVNCRFDPDSSLAACQLMKKALDKEGLKTFLMVQPVGYHTPDCGLTGFASLPESPLGELYENQFKFLEGIWLGVWFSLLSKLMFFCYCLCECGTVRDLCSFNISFSYRPYAKRRVLLFIVHKHE